VQVAGSLGDACTGGQVARLCGSGHVHLPGDIPATCAQPEDVLVQPMLTLLAPEAYLACRQQSEESSVRVP
jgi:hypothetical protein